MASFARAGAARVLLNAEENGKGLPQIDRGQTKCKSAC